MSSIAAKVGDVPPTEAELEQFDRVVDAQLRSLETSLAPYRRAPRPARLRRPLRDRVEEAGRKYAELQLKLDRETLDAALSPPAKAAKRR